MRKYPRPVTPVCPACIIAATAIGACILLLVRPRAMPKLLLSRIWCGCWPVQVLGMLLLCQQTLCEQLFTSVCMPVPV